MLEVRDLTVRWGDSAPVVDSVSFALEPGERLGMIGASGSGKSLTAAAIIGLLPAGARASGSIRLHGAELLGLPEGRLAQYRGAQVAMVFQDSLTALNPVVPLQDQVRLPLQRHHGHSRRAARAEARGLLVDVGLDTGLHDAHPPRLSGGQRQRACIAMALACRPALLIADEPTTALDTGVQAEILALLDRVTTTSSCPSPPPALLFITHDLPVVSQLCSHMLVMHEGRLVERGALNDLLTAPAAAATRSLLAAARALDEAAPVDPGA